MSEELHEAPAKPQHLEEAHKKVITDALIKANEKGTLHKVLDEIHNAAQDVKNMIKTPENKQEQKGFDIAQAVLNGLQAITHESVQMTEKIKAAQTSGDSEMVISEAMAGLFAIGKDAADMVAQIKKAQEQAAA